MKLAIVVPCYNEEEAMPIFYEEIVKVAKEMKKLESSLTNMVIVLTLIAIIAGGALAYVNDFTAPQIEKINKDILAQSIKDAG